MSDTKERPAYVRFERRAVEDRAVSESKGQYSTKDVDFVIITPVGTKDEHEKECSVWLEQIKQQTKESRLPPGFLEHYEKSYEHWKRGEELPINGTPIKGWQLLSPSQQANVIAANVRIVEDLAAANDEVLQRLGMGGLELKQKAVAWLKASKEVGTVVAENVALRAKVPALEAEVKRLAGLNETLAKNQKEKAAA